MSRCKWITRSPLVALALFALLLAGCVRPGPQPPEPPGPPEPTTTAVEDASQSSDPGATGTSSVPLIARLGTPVPDYAGQPTPDSAHYEIAHDSASTIGSHTIVAGETLGTIAQRYSTTVEELVSLNNLTNPDIIPIGSQLQVPGATIQRVVSPDLKIIPDSELVYGPTAADFDLRGFVAALDGRVVSYQEEVEGQMMDGPAIVQLVADRYSVGPRLLLAVLEHRAGWITQAEPPAQPSLLGNNTSGASSLYIQLSWAANLLNLGYYGRSEGGLRGFNLGETTQVVFSPTINDGTAGIQRFLGAVDGVTYDSWLADVGVGGLYATYNRLFGNPFAYTYEPLRPSDLTAPPLELPWSEGETWFYTGGPHGAWNTGSAWGALDFVPAAEQAGCIPSDAWVTAMAPGIVTRSGNGAVVVDLDAGDNKADGFAGTLWAVTYMHLETRDRIAAGTRVKTGDRLGHPSCEGGVSDGTHVHLARSFNGRWISADGDVPFEMSGWVSSGAGAEYDGYLTKGNVSKVACVCREDVNAITR